jgi:quinol monooxygenase YgiN
MLIVAGEIEIDPARRAEAVAAALEMMEATRREAGCLSYVFSADLVEAGRFRIFEEWQSPEALAAHLTTPHMAAFQVKIADLGVRGLKIQRYEVAAVAAMG